MADSMSVLNLSRNRNFLFLYLGGIISASGATISSLTIVWLVYSETKSALSITYVGIATIIPTICLGLIAGALVDRFDRRRLMIASDLIRAAAILCVPIYLSSKSFNLPVILGAVSVIGLFSTFFRPATNALLPALVKSESVQDANGLITASNSISQVIANAAGGVLIVVAGAILGLVYNTFTYLLSAVLIFLIAVPTIVTRQLTGHSSIAADIREGLRFMQNNKAVLETTLVSTILNFFAALITPFFVVYVSVYLHSTSSFYGVLLACLSFGIASGALLVGRLNTVGYAGKVFMIATFVFGLGTIGLVLITEALSILAIIAFLGLMLGILNTTYFSIMQLVVPNEVLGRVLSVDEVGSYAAIPLGQVVGGLLIQSYGVVPTYLVAGIGIVATAGATVLLKDMRRFRYSR